MRLIAKMDTKSSFPRELLGDIIDAGYFDIAKKIVDIWAYPECAAYLNKLIFQDRVGREGFPPIVMSALIDLQELRGLENIEDIWTQPKRN